VAGSIKGSKFLDYLIIFLASEEGLCCVKLGYSHNIFLSQTDMCSPEKKSSIRVTGKLSKQCLGL
jgi:hypothetical protein